MQIPFRGTVPKEIEYPDNNEDACLIDLDKKLIALSDGASESFDAKSWSNILVQKFINCPQLNESWLIEAVDSYSIIYNREELSWSKQASFDRGSFATLLGIEINCESKKANIRAIGDSLAVLIDDTTLQTSYPYTSFEDFKRKPNLLSTNHQLNDFIKQHDFLSHYVTWKLDSLSNPKIFCMTDALGEWFLKAHQEEDNACETLLSINSESQLIDFIVRLRNEKRIRTDDSTLIVIDLKV